MFKIFAILGLVIGVYAFVLMYTANMALDQTKRLQATYQSVAAQADRIAAE